MRATGNGSRRCRRPTPPSRATGWPGRWTWSRNTGPIWSISTIAGCRSASSGFGRRPIIMRRAGDWHGGALEGVLTAKRLSAAQRAGVVEDVERGFVDAIRPEPWQTCTCIGNWHYDRGALRAARLQAGEAGDPAARRHRLEERQSAAQHPGARRRLDRRPGGGDPRRDRALVRGRMARRSTGRGPGASSARARPGRRPAR